MQYDGPILNNIQRGCLACWCFLVEVEILPCDFAGGKSAYMDRRREG
jgi:hypothetical protein